MVLVHIHLCQTMPLFLEKSLRRTSGSSTPSVYWSGHSILRTSYADDDDGGDGTLENVTDTSDPWLRRLCASSAPTEERSRLTHLIDLTCSRLRCLGHR